MLKSKPRQRTIPKATRKEADAIWARFLRLKPEISTDQARRMEINFYEQLVNSRRTRLAAFAALSRSGPQLRKAFGSRAERVTAEAAAYLIASIESSRDMLRACAEGLDSAATRLQLAMSERPDLEALLVEARKSETRPAALVN